MQIECTGKIKFVLFYRRRDALILDAVQTVVFKISYEVRCVQASGHPGGRPAVEYFDDKMNFSANYLGDLLRKDTGKSALEHIQLHRIDAAKEKLFDKNKPVSEITCEPGFEYP
jgi:AraC-like DNA-binding protein